TGSGGLTMPDLSSLRLVKVPPTAPPYDCQVHGARCPASADDMPGVEEAPAASVLPVPSAWAAAAVSAAVAVSPGAAVSPAAVSAAAAVSGLVARPAAAADPVAARPRQLAVVIVEVLAGVRPDRQLVPMATDRVRARAGNLAPLLASGRRPRIARMVMSRPADRVVEMTVVVNFGARSRALAMRFEHAAARPSAPGWPARPARWLCTALEAG
ncbi:MAG TPA: Rv3235 family protein, partial [Streptosporangiaceae bacterium]|nr:Rv3235 family protein [Streptosporangiaceae bacterium]